MDLTFPIICFEIRKYESLLSWITKFLPTFSVLHLLCWPLCLPCLSFSHFQKSNYLRAIKNLSNFVIVKVRYICIITVAILWHLRCLQFSLRIVFYICWDTDLVQWTQLIEVTLRAEYYVWLVYACVLIVFLYRGIWAKILRCAHGGEGREMIMVCSWEK